VLGVRGHPEDRRLGLSDEGDRALLAVDTALGGGELVVVLVLVLCGVVLVVLVICGVVLVVLVGERGVSCDDRCVGVDVLWTQVLWDWLRVRWLVATHVRVLRRVLITSDRGVRLVLVFVNIWVGGRCPTVGLVVVVVSADVAVRVVANTATLVATIVRTAVSRTV